MKLPLLLAHGNLEFLIPVMFFGLPAALLGLILTVLAVIAHYRRKPAPTKNWAKRFGISAAIFWVITLCSPWMFPLVDFIYEHTMLSDSAGSQEEVARQADPIVITPEKILALIKKLPEQVGFGYSGAAYFQGKLYVSSNIGLLPIKDGKIESLLQWTKFDAVIEGPWFDRANQALWAQAANDGSLLRFDGTHWIRLPLPRPPAGYNRGDMLNGFDGRSTSRSFWLMGGNCIWRWEQADNAWFMESLPTLPDGSAVKAFFSWGDVNVFVVREGYQIGIESGNNPASVHVFDQVWRKSPGTDIDIAEAEQTDRAGFVRSRSGLLYQVTRDQMLKLDGPSACDAIATTSKGTLLASFGLAGVFERVGDQWEKRAASPFGLKEGEHWTHLAEFEGEIALATSTVPQLVSGTGKFVHSGTAGIWIARNGVFERIDGRE